jgi:hypothetical protein
MMRLEKFVETCRNLAKGFSKNFQQTKKNFERNETREKVQAIKQTLIKRKSKDKNFSLATFCRAFFLFSFLIQFNYCTKNESLRFSALEMRKQEDVMSIYATK